MSQENNNANSPEPMGDEFKDLDQFLAEESLMAQLRRYREPVKNDEASIEQENITVAPKVELAPEPQATKASEASDVLPPAEASKPALRLEDIPLVETDISAILGSSRNLKKRRYWPAPGFTSAMLVAGIVFAALSGLLLPALIGAGLSAAFAVLRAPGLIGRVTATAFTAAYAYLAFIALI